MLFRRTDIERYEARMARIARWDRPLEGPRDRLSAWWNMLAVDHGIFRLAYLNLHAVDRDLWRSAQPAPHQIRRFAAMGGRSLVYLRGGREHGSWALEKEAAAAAGLTLHEFVARSREAPDRDALLAAPAFFRDLAYPALIHCKSGADRAGFVAALYLIVHRGRPVAEALRQLSWRYGHVRWSKTGILDHFFATYAREGEARGMAFSTWVERHYDPERLAEGFRPGALADLLVDRLLRRE